MLSAAARVVDLSEVRGPSVNSTSSICPESEIPLQGCRVCHAIHWSHWIRKRPLGGKLGPQGRCQVLAYLQICYHRVRKCRWNRHHTL
ncbi:hypothetical protein M404DRAFT_239188 [Pisolithus tinctorius Marx 270]|uniref:Uncharacterized protein n=1 Tax=Pisolithus tinctorius Marx 270 TaxID=870435 RepID=A0A0C3N6A0_PISTI|nr:hypothetical protein M404DRAFT_239188 [Pisolithus tinctorius Marx 270]